VNGCDGGALEFVAYDQINGVGKKEERIDQSYQKDIETLSKQASPFHDIPFPKLKTMMDNNEKTHSGRTLAGRNTQLLSMVPVAGPIDLLLTV
jgi:hypothetical protein